MASRAFRSAVAAGAALAALVAVVALSSRDAPRCPTGLVPLGGRCCAVGQRLDRGACVGAPSACPSNAVATPGGCVPKPAQVRIESGSSSWKSPDTQVAATGQTASTGPFEIDKYEVSWARYRECSATAYCPAITPAVGGDDAQAVTLVTRAEARLFCRWVGGRLPTDAEWLRAAIGEKETRYPWGDPDALCTRAVWSLTNGRCSRAGIGADSIGARPSGATPLGVEDLAGNVAEWVDDAAPAGSAATRGGSWRDDDAALLRARSQRVVPDGTRSDWIGFRCAYDRLIVDFH